MRVIGLKRTSVIMGLAFLMVLSSLVPVYARSLKQIEADQKAKKEQLQGINRDISETSQAIINLAAELEKLEYQKEENEDQLKLLQGQLQQTEEEITKAQNNLNQRRDILGERLKNIYEDGAIGYFEVLVGSNNFSDFVNRFEFLKEVISSDNTLIDNIKDQKAFIEGKKAELVRQQQTVVSTKNKLANNISLIDSKQDILKSQIADNKKAARRAAQELSQLEDEEDKEIERIAREARKHNNNGNDKFQGEGEFLWPVPLSYTRISSGFGPRRSPVPGASSVHKGIDIPAPIGTSVQATQAGTVLYSTTMRGYGNVVWINHGGGIVSVYGHLNKILVSEGQHVDKGQIIAESGNTGVSSGPHLHFEVREDGTARSPLNYVHQP